MDKKDVSEKDAKRIKEAVTQLAKIPSNSLCADCQQQCTLWASVNIGVFICSRCAGMHRHLGVHITQVRSINLDVWTPAQLVSVLVNGNAWVNSWLMSKPGAPDIGRQRINDTSMSRHINEKYEKHRFGDATGLLLINKTTFPSLTVEKALELFKMAMSLHRQQNDHCSVRIELLKAAGYRGPANVPLKNPLNRQLVLLTDPTLFVFNEIKKASPNAQVVTVKAQVPTMAVPPVVAKQDKLVDLDEFTDFTSSAPVSATNGSSNGAAASTFDPFPTTTNVKPQVNGFANFALADAPTPTPVAPKPVVSKSIIDVDWLGSAPSNPPPAAVTSPIVDTGFGNFASSINSFNGSDSSVKKNGEIAFPAFGNSISPPSGKVDPTWPSTSSNTTATNGSSNAFDDLFGPAVPPVATAPAPVAAPVLSASNNLFPDLFAAAPPTPAMSFPSAAPLGAVPNGHVIPQSPTIPTTAPVGGGVDDVDFILSLYSK
uniref:Arf-GAP domain-containing protein n=1 Tax=Panagrellus redivivus TaxID=6233 RepID=A0A7E4WBP7_PANRE